MNDYSIILFQVWLALVWFKTNAFVEYFSRIRFFFKLFKMDIYYEWKKTPIYADVTYPQFLVMYYPNFLNTLVSCPICLISWLSVISSLIFWQNFGVISIGTLVVYSIMTRLLKNR